MFLPSTQRLLIHMYTYFWIHNYNYMYIVGSFQEHHTVLGVQHITGYGPDVVCDSVHACVCVRACVRACV